DPLGVRSGDAPNHRGVVIAHRQDTFPVGVEFRVKSVGFLHHGRGQRAAGLRIPNARSSIFSDSQNAHPLWAELCRPYYRVMLERWRDRVAGAGIPDSGSIVAGES